MTIQPCVSSLWQERRDKEVGNKLRVIMPQIDIDNISITWDEKIEKMKLLLIVF